MRFTRVTNTNYFTSPDSSIIVYVGRRFVQDEFDFSTSYTGGFNLPFILIFCFQKLNVYNPTIQGKFEKLIEGLSNSSSMMIWIDDLEADFLQAPYTLVYDHNKVQKFEVKKGTAEYLDISWDSGKDDALLVTYSPSPPRLFFRHQNNTELIFTANGGESRHSAAYLDLEMTRDRKRLGAIVLENGVFAPDKLPIQFVVPYLEKSKIGSFGSNLAILIKYFDDNEITNKYRFAGRYYPYRRENAAAMNVSEFSLIPINPEDRIASSLFVDDTGTRLVTTELDKLVLTPVEVHAGVYYSYFLTVGLIGAAEINFEKSKSEFILLGYSGTEYVKATDHFTLKFVQSNNIVVDTDGNKIVSLEGNPTLGLPALSKDGSHFLDAEKAPLFDNSSPDYTEQIKSLQKASSRKVPYKHQGAPPFDAKTIRKDIELPIIPTLSFGEVRTDLLTIEKVFSAARLKIGDSSQPANSSGTKTNISPQGFIKDGDKYHFVKSSPNQPGKPAGSHRFTVTNIDLDFRLSISKDDVFFVTSPEILDSARRMGSTVGFDILFAIREFKVDLQDYKSQADLSEKVVIFKYSKSSFSKLLGDTSTWSNFGNFRVERVLKAAADSISKYLEPLRNTSDPNYDYLRQLIDDPNWNGVVVLNIPLGEKSPPDTFKGLTAFQTSEPGDAGDKLKLETALKFQFVAFPVNKTFINENNLIDIRSTSLYGLIDYDLIEEGKSGLDYVAVHEFFLKKSDQVRFVLTKLLIKFDNSEITNFRSFAFVQIPNLFDDPVKIDPFKLTHKDPEPQNDAMADAIDNLIRLKGSYHKNRDGIDEFNFEIESNIEARFETSILEKITLTKAAFSHTGGVGDEYRFDFDGSVRFNSSAFDSFADFLHFEHLDFQNIGFKFQLAKLDLKLDLSKLIALPEIDFRSKKGFLSSFPVKFNRFQTFAIEKGEIPRFDFLSIALSEVALPETGSLFSLIFDFDLGTLGNLGALKTLKGELLLGWSKGSGFKLGLKLNAPSADGLHINLFGALKLDIEEVALGRFKPGTAEQCSAYYLRLNDARLTIFGMPIPPDETTFNGIIIADPNASETKVAWLINVDGQGPSATDPLILGVGQRMGPPIRPELTLVADAIADIKKTFQVELNEDSGCLPTDSLAQYYQPSRNWLVASEKILPDAWAKILDFSFIFNDPALYGVHLGLKGETLKGLKVDILYKKLSENLGVWSLEIELPREWRNVDIGGAAVTLPAIGIEIYTNGSWKLDIGFPRGNDWSRSCLIQFRTPIPIVGWAGFYVMKANSANISLFKGTSVEKKDVLILQAGLALRAGVGAYIDKGIFYAGASISIYGILEGAFAFDKFKADGVTPAGGLSRVFPDHFALQGRVGSIAEVIGYVDFTLIKASVRIVLRQEIGLLLVMIKGEGLLPVTLYIEGQVSVDVDFTISCFKVFGHRICITIHFSFTTTIRFQYTLGGERERNAVGGGGHRMDSGAELTFQRASFKTPATVQSRHSIKIESIGKIPVTYLPGLTKDKNKRLLLVHNFAIPFFGKSVAPIKKDGTNEIISYKVSFSKNNLLIQIVKGLFEDLIKGLPPEVPSTYDNLRAILLDRKVPAAGTGEEITIKLNFDNFRPWFISGLRLEDKSSNDRLKNTFGFNDDEIAELRKNLNVCPETAVTGVGKLNCLFRLIPIPISSAINYGSFNDTPEEMKQFTIVVENLVKTKDGKDTVTTEFSSLTPYTEAELDALNRFFDNYRTQYLGHNIERTVTADPLSKPDLRQNSIIPEYFKLLGLLALEGYYKRIIDKFKEVEQETAPEKRNAYLNPTIEAADQILADDNYQWNLNGHLEEIIGQLNYFYNNGLRLPKNPLNCDSESLSYFEILNQFEEISGKSTLKDVRVKFHDTKSPGDWFDLTSELFPSQTEVNDFEKLISKQEKVDFQRIEESFTSKISTPYALVPVSLAIQNNDGKGDRFFKMPERILTVDDKSQYRFELNYRRRTDENVEGRDITASGSICAIIELKVKGYGPRKNTAGAPFPSILEISNVSIDDLNLMRKIRSQPDFLARVAQIEVYTRDGNTFEKITDKRVNLIKTNLSNKTHPPLFSSLIAATEMKSNFFAMEYIADTTSGPKFAELLWDGAATNDRGYFLLFEEEIKGFYDPANPEKQYDLLIAFELPSIGKQNSKFHAFCNYLKLPNLPIAPKIGEAATLYDALDGNAAYLSLNLLSADNNEADGTPMLVKEYHSTIPPHCMAFELSRAKDITPKDGTATDEYSQYLPIEFELLNGGKKVISKDQVLPVMPVEPAENETEKDKTRILYKHVSPLINYREDEEKADASGTYPNAKRYSAVGEKYDFNFGVRDTYGFRAIDNLAAISLKQKQQRYFDKLIPIEAWSPLRFSYWLKDCTNTGELRWELTASIDLKSLLPALGISTEIGPKGNGKLKSQDWSEQAQRSFRNILGNLYTVQAQLLGRGVTVTIDGIPDDQAKTFLSECVRVAIKSVLDLYEKRSFSIDFTLPQPQVVTVKPAGLKTTLLIQMKIRRANEFCIDLVDAWEADLVRETTNKVTLQNPANGASTNPIQELQTAIKTESAKGGSGRSFGLGISTNDKRENVLYIIDETIISDIKVAQSLPLRRSESYFGIKPYSNKLWSGSYISAGNPVSNFSSIDLDSSLRTILSKIDQILNTEFIQTHASDLTALDLLIRGKKSLVTEQLSKVLANVDDDQLAVPSLMVEEFRNLVLSKLGSFYKYDGIMKLSLTAASLDMINPKPRTGEDLSTYQAGLHRLSISIVNQPDYNFTSSKIGYFRDGKSIDEKRGGDWAILFDKVSSEKEILFQPISALVTHIEYDIKTIDSNSGIESSKWIQLIEPVKIDQQINVEQFDCPPMPDTMCDDRNWLRVERSFPNKPIIQGHRAIQSHPNLDRWDQSKVGKWRYELEIKKEDDAGFDDKLNVRLNFQAKDLGSGRSSESTSGFEGFIAYWSSKITDGENTGSGDSFEWRQFASELNGNWHAKSDKNQNPDGVLAKASNQPNAISSQLNISVGRRTDRHWYVEQLSDATYAVSLKEIDTVQPTVSTLLIDIDGFDVLKNGSALTIQADAWIVRNSKAAKNRAFIYQTEPVRSATWATPHLHYSGVLGVVAPENLNTIFAHIQSLNLAFKSTVKHVLDVGRFADATLPYIPLRQLEVQPGAGSLGDEPEKYFVGYENGHPAVSLTIYSASGTEDGDLPVFTAEVIKKE